MPKVSVLVPIFNVEKYLEECLDSIVNQTLKDIEIICINDGSTDNSLKIIKKYAKNDPRIVIVNKKNSGYGDSMNHGLEKATGDYIGVVESDDWIELTAFEDLLTLAEANDAEVVKSNFYNYFSDPERANLSGTIEKLVNDEEVGRIIDPSINAHIFYQRPAIWSAIYKKSFLDDNAIRFLPTPGASYQDTAFAFKVWASASRVCFTKKAYLHYRQDNESSSVNSPGKVFCVAEEYAEIKKFLQDTDRYDRLGEIMRVTKWGAYAWNIDRLTPELAKDFIELASKEYAEDIEAGVFNYELCDVNQARAINEIVNNPSLVLARREAAYKAKVAVIVPAYNVENYIKRTIEHLQKQTLKDIEIIVVDDGSIDDTSDILEKYYKNDPRIILINQNNSGASVARNRALEKVHADYITFCDGDDFYEYDSVEKLYKTITKSKSDITVGSINVIYEDKLFTAVEKNRDKQYYAVKFRGTQDITDLLIRKVDVSPCNKIFKRSIIVNKGIKFPAGLKYEDAYFFHAYAWSAQKISFLPPEDYIYNYIRRQGSTMAQTFGGSHLAYDHIEIAILLFKFLKRNDELKNHADYFSELFDLYYHFSYRHLPGDQHARLANRVQQFLKDNGSYLDSIDPSIRTRIENLPLVIHKVRQSPQGIVKSKLKGLAQKTLPKISVSYRAQRHILDSTASIHHKIDALNEKTNRKIDQLNARLNEIAERLEEKGL